MSDVPFGVLLSGGVDSSANVALMSQLMDRPVRTFTVGFSDHEHLNELGWARAWRSASRPITTRILVDEKAMREYLPSLVYSQDEPIADWVCIPLYFVSKLGAGQRDDRGPGRGGRRRTVLRLQLLHALPRHVSPLLATLLAAARAGAGCGGGDGARSDWSRRQPRSLPRPARPCRPQPGAVLERRRGLWRVTEEPLHRRDRLEPLSVHEALSRSGLLPDTFARADSYEVVRSFFERLDAAAPGSDQLTRMIYSEFKLRLPELLLMRVDKIGMSVSIEPRVPFLDHLLVELTMTCPRELKVEGGIAKSLLKQSVRGLLPDDVIDRPKMGFGAPMLQWLRGPFGEAVRAELESTRFFDRFPARREVVLDMLDRHREGKAEFSLYVWTVYNAVAWFDYWVDKSREMRVA